MKKTTFCAICALLGIFNIAQAQPVISVQPQSRTNNIGDNARFVVIVSGTNGNSFQWQFNGTNISGGVSTASTTSTTNTLDILLSDANQAGIYSVIVTNGGTTNSSGAGLVIPYSDRTKITQWNFNSAPADTNTATGVLTPSIGSGTPSWPLMTLNNWLEGSSSDPAALGTDNSGRSLQGPTTGRANKTAGAQFAVSTLGYKNIVVTWEQYANARACAYWRGQYTTNGTVWVDRVVVDKRTPYLAANASTFTFHSDDLTGVSGVDNNTNFAYRIVAEYESTATGSGSAAYVMTNPNDPGGYNTSGAHRWDMVSFLGTIDTSAVQPIIATQPQSQTNYVGANTTFSVAATGGNLLYQWLFEGNTITNATNLTLILTNIQISSAGNYSVIVSNSAGFTNSENALLTVEAALAAGDRHWSGDGTILGGAGTWNTTAPRWSTTTDAPFNLSWNNASLDNAIFDVPAGSVTIGEPLTVNKINVVGDANYTFSGTDRITFTNDSEFNCTSIKSSSAVTFTCPLGADILAKTGAGRLHLNNTGNNVNKFVATAGIISVQNGSSLGSNPVTLLPDRITLDGAGLGFEGVAPSLSGNRGMTLGAGGGKLAVRSGGVVLTVSVPITGPGGISFPGFNAFHGSGIYGAAETFVFSNPANDYQGGTTVSVGTLRCGASEVLPNTTTLTLSGSSIFNLNGFTETVGTVIVNGSNARLQDAVGGASLIATNYDVRQGGAQTAVLAGNASLTKTTAGDIQLNAPNTYTGDTFFNSGTITLNAVGRFGNGAGTLHLDGGQAIILTEPHTEANTLLNPVVMTLETVFQSSATATNDIIFRHGGTWTTTGGTLYLFNPSTFSFELALTNTFNFTQPIDIGSACRLTSFNPAGSDQTFSGGISGSGTFRRSVGSGDGGRTIFATGNGYSGGTAIEAGTLLVNNPDGSGTGSGSVTVNAPSGVLGGTGIVSGNVTVNDGGSIAPGASAGILTLQGGLNMTNGGTMIWELAMLKDDSQGVAGTDFDQLVVTGGELALGGTSKLSLQFASGTAPDAANAFWQAIRNWTIVRLSGGLNTANAAFASIVNGSYSAGNFSIAVSSGNIVLTFTPSVQTGPSITMHPQSRTNVVGTTATFTVAATGSDPLTYEWFRSTAPFTPISGATSAIFTITNVQAANAGSYFARVYNDIGTATSQTASLTLVSRPMLQPLSGAGTTNVVLNWSTINGTQYQLQSNTNLTTTNWVTITNIVASGTTLSITNHPPAGDPQRYFRLLVQ